MSYHNSDLLEKAKSRCTDCEYETVWMGLYHCSHPEVDTDITAVIQCPIQDGEEGYIGQRGER